MLISEYKEQYIITIRIKYDIPHIKNLLLNNILKPIISKCGISQSPYTVITKSGVLIKTFLTNINLLIINI